jgi:hypothetical protein
MWDQNEDEYFHWSLHAIPEASSCKWDLPGVPGGIPEYSQLGSYVIGVYWLTIIINEWFARNHWCIGLPKIYSM